MKAKDCKQFKITSILKSPKYRTWQYKYFINAVGSRFEIKLIHVTLKKPWNLIGCFVFSVASSLAGKKMRFKAKNGAIRE